MTDSQTLADFEVLNHGTIVQVIALTDEAKDWINDNVDAPSYMWNGTILNIEHRMAGDIIAGMEADGLEGH